MRQYDASSVTNQDIERRQNPKMQRVSIPKVLRSRRDLDQINEHVLKL